MKRVDFRGGDSPSAGNLRDTVAGFQLFKQRLGVKLRVLIDSHFGERVIGKMQRIPAGGKAQPVSIRLIEVIDFAGMR